MKAAAAGGVCAGSWAVPRIAKSAALKFTGEIWDGEGEDLVGCDRVILVRQTN